MKVPQTKSFDNEPKVPNVPEGVYKAVIYSIVDLGTQKLTGDYGDQEKRQIQITWEIPSVRKVFKEENGEQPCVLSKKLTLSMHEKSNLRAITEAMIGKKFTSEDEAYAFDTDKLIGKTCQIFVAWNPTGEYANIQTVMKNTDTINIEPENEVRLFTLDNPDWKVFEGMSKYVKELIMKSPEYQTAIEKQNMEDTNDEMFTPEDIK